MQPQQYSITNTNSTQSCQSRHAVCYTRSSLIPSHMLQAQTSQTSSLSRHPSSKRYKRAMHKCAYIKQSHSTTDCNIGCHHSQLSPGHMREYIKRFETQTPRLRPSFLQLQPPTRKHVWQTSSKLSAQVDTPKVTTYFSN